jgi:hypothetical protein
VEGGRSIKVEHSTIQALAGVIVGGSTICSIGYIKVNIGGTWPHREYLRGSADCDLNPPIYRYLIRSNADVVPWEEHRRSSILTGGHLVKLSRANAQRVGNRKLAESQGSSSGGFKSTSSTKSEGSKRKALDCRNKKS